MNFTNKELEKIEKMVTLIDLNDYYIVSKYGLPAQNKIKKLSDNFLSIYEGREESNTAEKTQVQLIEYYYTLEYLKLSCDSIYRELSMFLYSGSQKLKASKGSEYYIELFKERLYDIEISRKICSQIRSQASMLQINNKQIENSLSEVMPILKRLKFASKKET